MSQSRVHTSVKAAGLAICIMLAISGLLNAQSYKQTVDAKTYTIALGNLRSGITSDNLGLRKSSIYFAGKYTMGELSNDLLAQISRESDANTRILIGMSLYTIGDVSGMQRLQSYTATEKDSRIKRMLSEICQQFSAGQKNEFAEVSK